MTIAHEGRQATARIPLFASSVFVLAIVVAVLAILLCLPLSTPIGAMYWDLMIYFDAANRIFHGNVPVIDFFVPVGPLGYYLFAGGLKLFPNAQPLLLVDWSLLLVTAPIMAAILWQTERQSRAVAFAVLIPFLVFTILPFNTKAYYPYPGSDGFGIYNRQVCQILYTLVAALIFVRGQRLLGVLVTVALTALLFTKITGFVAGFLICLFAFVAGRMAFRTAVVSAIAFFAILGGLELWDGLISNYASDILSLLHKNSDTLLPRLLQAASRTFGISASAGLLALFLLWMDRQTLLGQCRDFVRRPSFAAVPAIINHDAFWIAAVVVAGIIFESQNTGSQALIFLWPVLLAVFVAHVPAAARLSKSNMIVAILIGATALPPFVAFLERAARTYIGAFQNVALRNNNLKTLGRVTARPEIMARAEKMVAFYPRHTDTFDDFVRIGELPGYIFYSEFNYQLEHLMTIDRAVSDIRALEAAKGVHFNSIFELNFVDPIPYLMNRASPKYVAIGADPARAVPKPGSEEENAVRDVDLVLYPTCPPTPANRDLYKLYAPALKNHFKIKLDACFDAYVNPRFAGKL
ncbi:MAG: hypothetical protein ACTHJV_10980 [Rhizobiaceae bacterium]